MQNLFVSHKIENMCESHKTVISESENSISEGEDRGVFAMVCDGPNWCPMDYM